MPETVGSPLLWGGFIAAVVLLLVLDLFVLHRKSHAVSLREAATWSAVWVGLALIFNVFIGQWFGATKAMEFFTGYLIEKALSVDNLFVFLVLFSYFAVPNEYQHKVLFWGVLGAIVMRALFITVGAALLHNFHWIIYVFGAFLVFTGWKILTQKNEHVDPEKNPVIGLVKRLVPVTPQYHGDKFFIIKDGKRWATPLFLVLVAVEFTDVVFAVDSIPAIFAVTPDPFIVFTSNIFAILGLRSLYFLLAGIMDRFRYLKVGLGLVLGFIGVKMLVMDFYKIPVGVSLGVVAALLGGSVVASLVNPPLDPPLPHPDEHAPGVAAEEPSAG